MRILIINSFFSEGGPPRIVKGIYDTLISNGNECLLAAGRNKPLPGMNTYKIGSFFNQYYHYFVSAFFDSQGFSSKHATNKLINMIGRYKPDIINIHNLHGHYINIKLLFDFIKKSNIPVVWTLHDCWAFTGHCAHFDYIKCERWKEGCFDCQQKKAYPKSVILDFSKRNYQIKKEIFTSLDKMVMVTPSVWLQKLTEKSFLKKYPVKTIYNGIDLSIFKPTSGSFREKYGIQDKKIILGVSQNWSRMKGLYDLIHLGKILDKSFVIVIVGLTKKQMKSIPDGIIGITRTESIKELTDIYTAADVFVNPTYEDTFPTVNLEALACGTPVITYKTGGSPEAVSNICGIVVSQGDIEALTNAIINIDRYGFRSDACRERAFKFERNKRFYDYIELFNGLIKNNTNGKQL
jgi:putative colanic acid biosynthesis glycosyltransferase